MTVVWIVLIGIAFFVGSSVGKDVGKEEAYAGQHSQIQNALTVYGKFHEAYGIRGTYGLDGHETRLGDRFFIVHADEFKARFVRNAT